MAKQGKELEKTIKLIEDTLKDSLDTIVYNNHKVKNIGGRYREFDVFIESKISGHEIKIAIECKDFKSKISAEKIEAFETKCKRTPSINKKVFVSSNGFQAEAVNVAKDCGIELRIASKVDKNQILSWFPITRLDIKLIDGGSGEIFLDVDEKSLEEINFQENCKFLKDKSPVLLSDYIFDFYKKNRYTINNIVLLNWMKLDSEMQKTSFFIDIKLETPDLIYVNTNETNIKVVGIVAKLNFKLEHTIVQPLENIVLKDLKANIKADTMKIDLDNGNTANFVRTPDNKTTIYIDAEKEKMEYIKFIASYDPKTNRFDTTNREYKADCVNS